MELSRFDFNKHRLFKKNRWMGIRFIVYAAVILLAVYFILPDKRDKERSSVPNTQITNFAIDTSVRKVVDE